MKRLFTLLGLLTISIASAHAAIYSVTNTNDSGSGSFRQALIDATTGGDIIELNITGASGTINLLSALPTTLEDITINSNGKTLTLNSSPFALAAAKTTTFDIDTADTTFTINDAITGAGSIAKTGVGTLFLTTTSTYSIGTALNAGIISIQAEDNLGNSALTFNGGTLQTRKSFTIARGMTLTGAGTFDTNGNDNTISGMITGAGAFTKTGSGKLTLTNATNDYTGLTTVEEGTLAVVSPGVLGATGVTIKTGATFMGNGTLGGNLTNESGGTYSPGNGAIFSQVFGSTLDYTANAGSTTIIRINPNNTDVDLIDLTAGTGTATLAGTVKMQLEEIPNGTLPADKIFINTGSMLTLTSPTYEMSGSFTTTVVSTATSAAYQFTGYNSFSSFAQTGAQSDIGSVFDALTAGTVTGELKTVMLTMVNFSTTDADKRRAAMEQLSPDLYNNLYFMSVNDSNQFMHRLLDRTSYLRSHYAENSGNLPLLVHSGCSHHIKGALKKHCALSPHKDWEVYTDFYGNYTNFESHAGYVGYQAGGGNVLVGTDRYMNDNLLVGLALGGGYTTIDFDHDRGDGSFHGYHISPYLGYQNRNFFWDSSVAYGIRFFDIERCIGLPGFGRVTDGDVTSHELSASSHAGYNFNFDQFVLTPTAGLDFVALFNNDFAESGAGSAGFSIDDNDQQSLKTNLGFKAAHMSRNFPYPVLFEVSADWRFELLDRNSKITGKFLGTTTSGNFTGCKVDRNSLAAGAKATLLQSEFASMHFAYSLELGNRYLSHNIGLGWNVHF